MKPQFPLRPLVLAIASALPLLMGAPAFANPEHAKIIHGSADIQQVGKMLTIKSTPNAIIEWQKFNIAKDEATRFQQESAKSIVLNRVSGIDPSQILGQLSSNGRVFLINKNGLLVGKDARIDTAGFVASTLDIKNDDFINGRYRFDGSGGKIAVEGMIRSQNGDVFLISPDIKNSGLIEASNGNVVLAAGKSVEIVSLSLEGMRFTLQAPSDSVINLGQIKGDAVGLFAGTLKHSGDIRAVRAEQVGGRVLLRASDKIETSSGSRIDASGAVAGQITLDAGPAGTLLASGQINATGLKGGEVQLLGKHVGLFDHAEVDASGQQAGGSILVGGDYQGKNNLIPNSEASYTSADSTLRADALAEGDGGKVIVWADKTTRVNGQISARGGALGGDGGLIETSGKDYLDFKAKADTSAPKGKAGTLLLDPNNITIATTGTPVTNSDALGVFDNSTEQNSSYVLTGDIDNALVNNNVTVKSSGTISLANSYTYNSSRSLTLDASNAYPESNGITTTVASEPAIYNAITNNGLGDIILKTAQNAIEVGAITTNGNISLEALSLTLNGNITSGSNKKISIKALGEIEFDDGTDTSKMRLNAAALAKLSTSNLEFKTDDTVSIKLAIDRTGKNLSLYGKEGISQSSSHSGTNYITASHLSVSTLSPAPSGSTYIIDLGKVANRIDQFSSKSEGPVYLKNDKPLEIVAHPELTSSSKMGNQSWIENNGNISQSAAITLSTNANFPSLSLYTSSGNINLDNSNNNIARLTAKTASNGASITFKNNSDLTLITDSSTGRSGGDSTSNISDLKGVSTNNGAISIENSGSVTFSGIEVNAGTANTRIITTAANKSITIPTSSLSGDKKITAGNITLQADHINLTDNTEVTVYGSLAASGGTVTLLPTTSGTSLQIGGTSRSGFGITQNEFQNITANTIKIGSTSYQMGAVDIASLDLLTSSPNTVLEIYSMSSINQSGRIKAKGLMAKGSSITLNNTGNVFNDGISLNASSDINIDYSGILNLGFVGYTDGLVSSNDINASSSGNIVINKNISAKNLTMNTTGGSISQSGGFITANKITATSANAISLAQDNKTDTLTASNNSGDISIKNGKALTVNSLKGNGNIDLNITGDLLINGELSATNASTINLKAANLSEGSSGSVTAANLNITATGAVALDKTNQISKAAISGSSLNLNNNQALTLGVINTGSGDVKVSNAGSILLNDTLTANTSNISSDNNIDASNTINVSTAIFNATNKFSQSGKINSSTSTINAGNLELNGIINADTTTLSANKNDIVLGGSILSKTSTISATAGSISELSNGAISSNQLNATAATGITLEKNNTIDSASLKTTKGNVSLNNSKILSLEQSRAEQFKLINSEGLVLKGNLSASQIDITAKSMSDSTTATLTGSAKISSTGDIVLNNSTHTLSALAASSSGDLILKNKGTLSLLEIKAKGVNISNEGKLSTDGSFSSADIGQLQSSTGISINNTVTGKNINLKTDQFNMGSQGKIETTDFIYTPMTADTIKVSLGGNTKSNTGVELLQSDFDRIKASKIIIGDAKGSKVGDTQIKGFNTGSADLFINSSGALSQSSGGKLISKTLNVQAASIKLTEENTVDQFIPVSNGDIFFSNSTTLALGAIKTSGLLAISAKGNIGINEQISAQSVAFNASGNVSEIANGSINTEQLAINADSGIKLENSNKISQTILTSQTGDISLNNNSALFLSDVIANQLKIKNSDALLIGGTLNTNKSDISGSSVSDNNKAQLMGDAIIKSAGDIILNNATHNINKISASAAGVFSLKNKTDLSLQDFSTKNMQINSDGKIAVDGVLSNTELAKLQAAGGIMINNKISSKSINFVTDKLAMGSQAQIEGSELFYTPLSNNNVKVFLGGNSQSNTGFVLNNSDLSRIKSANIIIGDAKGNKTGDVLISGFSIGDGSLTLNSTGDIRQTAGGTINAKSLNAQSASINLGEANTVDLFSPTSSGDIVFANTKTLALGAINTAGQLQISTDGNLGINDTIVAKNINLKANSGTIISLASGTLSTDTLSATAGKGIKLDNENTINQASLSSAEGDVSINNAKALTLGKTSSNANLRISVKGSLTSSDAISSKTLDAKASGDITLEKENVLDQARLISDSGNISLVNNKALALEGSSSNGGIKINNTGDLNIKGSLTGKQLQFKILNGRLTEANDAVLAATAFVADAELGINLQNNNTVDTAGLTSKGDINFNNSKSIELAGVISGGSVNINSADTLKLNDQLQGGTVILKANSIIDSSQAKIKTNSLQTVGLNQISLDKGNHSISQFSASSSGDISLLNNTDLTVQTINSKAAVLIDNQGTLSVISPFSADDTSLLSKGDLRINSGSFKSTGTIKLTSRDTGANNDNIIQNTDLIAAGDIKVNANDTFIQNANLIAGATQAQLNSGSNNGARAGAQRGVKGTTGEISVDAAVIQVAKGVKAISASGGAISYGSARTISNNISPDQIQTTGVVNKIGKNLDSPLLNNLPLTASPEQVEQIVKIIVLQNQDQQSHFQIIGTGQLPFEAKKPEELEPPKETIRVAGEDDANCP
ncbi:two-partner secretion domain-containing protein [Iodobacter fluviatilis]|uniref:Filamentous hemagglutinin family protein n=1 Tax=Iodobacter fluviatilis TaxID=537 RepID=A0A377SYX9_9NEIS|nr:filamentous hemagglutinin N-terminal domain-containing protein [Iodobacter fluviatilis]TCU88218.1 filamentous hemagglutinin family protein [Iodobacter fluviatilis]STR45719.1 Heme:hemopexin utilization protein A [Iodobacter fluviatilis]